MNAWFTRLLAGAACTVGALALSAGAAQADDHHHGLDLGVVHISTHHGHDHPSQGSHRSSSRTSVATRQHATNVRVSIATRPGSNPTQSRRTYVQVRAGAVEPEKAHEATAAKAKAKAAKVAKVRTAKAAKVRAVGRQHAVDARAEAALVKGLVPATRVLTEGRVLDLPVRACVVINADGCGRASTSTRPTGATGSGSTTPTTTSAVTVVAHATAVVPVVGDLNACVLVDAAGCTAGGGTPPTGPSVPLVPVVPVAPVVIGEVGAEVPGAGTVAACALVNASGCTTGTGTTPTAPAGPTDPGDNGDSNGDNSGGDSGDDSGNRATSTVVLAGPQGLGFDHGLGGDHLAQTGGTAGVTELLGAGLLLLLAGLVLTLRRRRG